MKPLRIKDLCFSLFLLPCLLFFAGKTNAQRLWHSLEKGPYNVGFKMEWKFDYSRSWPDQMARPVRMHIWYPAVRSGIKKMEYGKYVYNEAPSPGFKEYNDALIKFDVGDSSKSLLGCFKGSAKLFAELMETPTACQLNSAPLPGHFPVIIYSLGQNDYTQENTVLSEFLASHGYIVISVAQWGPLPRKKLLMIDEELSFEAQVRDLEFATSFAYGWPNADKTKIAAAGHSMGGVYALLLAMRNKNIRLIIGLDASFTSFQESYVLKYKDLRYYDPWNFKIPLVQLCKIEQPRNDDILNALKFSDRAILSFPKLIHSDFSSFPMVTSTVPLSQVDEYAIQHRSQAEAVKGHEEICRLFLNYLNKYLKQEKITISSNIAIIENKKAFNAPSEEELASMQNRDGFQKALTSLQNAIRTFPADTLIREKVMNRIAFEFLISNRLAEGINMYLLSTVANPRSESAFLKLAGAYEDAGNIADAEKYYSKVLELNPANADARKSYDKLKSERKN